MPAPNKPQPRSEVDVIIGFTLFLSAKQVISVTRG